MRFHPSIVCNRFIPFMRLQEVLLEPIPTVSGRGQGTPWAAINAANCTSGEIQGLPTKMLNIKDDFKFGIAECRCSCKVLSSEHKL